MTRIRRPDKEQDNGLDTHSITSEKTSNKTKSNSEKLIRLKDIQEQEDLFDDNNPVKYKTDTQRVLDRLKNGSLTCKQARDEFDINSLPQRIHNLRQLHHKIITEWVTVIKDSRKRRIAKYTLIVQEVCNA